MDTTNQDAVKSEGHRFGTGDLLGYIGSGLSTLFFLLMMIRFLDRAPFEWVATSQLVMIGLSAFAIVSTALSRKRNQWLIVNFAWAGLVAVMLVGRVSTLSNMAAGGLDFFILIGAVLVAAGAYMARAGLGVWPERRASPAADPRAQLAELKEMIEKGLITQEDYEKKRASLVDKL